MSYVHFISSRYLGEPQITVKRDKNVGAQISFGRDNSVFMDMETLKRLCNDMAAVLDEWFEEADRRGRSASDGRETNVSLPDERDRKGGL